MNSAQKIEELLDYINEHDISISLDERIAKTIDYILNEVQQEVKHPLSYWEQK